MCLLCISVQKQNMSVKEVARAYREVELEDGHHGDFLRLLEQNYDIDEVGEAMNELHLEEFEKKIGTKL